MSSQDDIAEIVRLRDALTRLERSQRRSHRLQLLLGGLVAIGALAAFSAQPAPRDGRRADAPISTLYAREFVVVDSAGVPRVRIGAPLPEPIMLGKRFRRRGAVSGVLLYDSEGNERGGYVTGDSGRGAALTLDEINRAAVHLGVNDRGEMHLTLSNGQGSWSGLGISPRGSYLQVGSKGKILLNVPDTTAGAR